jgi:hypothetical protein
MVGQMWTRGQKDKRTKGQNIIYPPFVQTKSATDNGLGYFGQEDKCFFHF